MTVPGNAVLHRLPIDAHKDELAELLRNKTHVGVSAPPGSGRSELVAKWILPCLHFNAKVNTDLIHINLVEQISCSIMSQLDY